MPCRCDTRGTNLNRFYTEPNMHVHPTICAAKAVCVRAHDEGLLHMYVDLHAHASKRGCFMFGNQLPDLDDQVSVLFMWPVHSQVLAMWVNE